MPLTLDELTKKKQQLFDKFLKNDEGEILKILNQEGGEELSQIQLNEEGETALHLAASKGFLNICTKLVELGAPLEANTNNGITPLHYATNIWVTQTEVVDFFLDKGARIDPEDIKRGKVQFTDKQKYILDLEDRNENLKKVVDDYKNQINNFQTQLDNLYQRLNSLQSEYIQEEQPNQNISGRDSYVNRVVNNSKRGRNL